jgi:hypothetical protein
MADEELPDAPWASGGGGGGGGELPDAPWATKPSAPAQAVPAASPTLGDIGSDIAKSAAIGVPKGIIGFAGLPEQVAGWAASGLGYLTGRDPESFRVAPENRPPSTQEIRSAVERVTGPLYEPKTTYGRYAQTVGEFAPGAVLGPGALVPRLIGQAIVPGLMTEGAGDIAGMVSPDLEPYAKGATAVFSGIRGVGKAEKAAAEASRRQLLDVEMPAGTKALYQDVDRATLGVPVPMMDRTLTVQQMRNELNAKGIQDIPGGPEAAIHKRVDALADINNASGLVQWRRNMRERLFDAGEGRAAGILTPVIDQAIDRAAPGAAAALQRADREYGLMRLSQSIDQRFRTVEEKTAAANSGANLDNKLRQSLTAFKADRRAWGSLPAQDQLMVDNMIKGNISTNAMRFFSNVLGGGGGLGMAVASVVTHAMFGPGAGVTAPIIGKALKRTENISAEAEANRFLASVLGRSEFAPTSALDRMRAIPFWERPARWGYYGTLGGAQPQVTPQGYPYFQAQ